MRGEGKTGGKKGGIGRRKELGGGREEESEEIDRDPRSEMIRLTITDYGALSLYT